MKRTALTWLTLGLLTACGSVTPIGETTEQLGADSGAPANSNNDGDDGEAPSTPQETGLDPTAADDDTAPVEPSPDESSDTAVEVPIDIDDDTSSGVDDETTSDEPSSGGTGGEEPGDSETDPTSDETTDPPAPGRCDGIACGEPCPALEDAFCYADGTCHLIPPDCELPPEEPTCPDSCVFPAVCRLCEDGSCASVTATCNEDGSCGEPTFECTDEAPSCPSTCAVPRICEPCNDGCAEPVVSCNEDGSCGEIEWVCEEEPPVGEECPANCSVPAICQICQDGSCAIPDVSCTMDGGCGDVAWECPAPEPMCETAGDCLSTFLVACEVCENGESSCPQSDCVDGQCVLAFPGCGGEYDPCAGKAEGDSCSLCAPNDPDCIETDEIKSCQNGQCLSQIGDPAK